MKLAKANLQPEEYMIKILNEVKHIDGKPAQMHKCSLHKYFHINTFFHVWIPFLMKTESEGTKSLWGTHALVDDIS